MAIILEGIGLTKRFGDFTAVDNISLQVQQGEIFGLLGPNGAGKTTTIKLLTGLLKPDEGSVLFKGQKIRSGHKKVVAKVGVCPQEIVMWGRLTCMEQLIFLGEMYDLKHAEAKARGEELLKALELDDKSNSLAKTLSGGMQRRLNIAMALVNDPDILILDEPEAGLDPQSRVLVRDFIRSMAGDKSIILTTHNMDEADRMSDRVAIIDQGKLQVVDTPRNLKSGIGEGDVLEIILAEKLPSTDLAEQLFAPYKPEISYHILEKTIFLRGLNILQHIPNIVNQINQSELKTEGFHLRENTLEDIFIQLTGRRLRE